MENETLTKTLSNDDNMIDNGNKVDINDDNINGNKKNKLVKRKNWSKMAKFKILVRSENHNISSKSKNISL